MFPTTPVAGKYASDAGPVRRGKCRIGRTGFFLREAIAIIVSGVHMHTLTVQYVDMC